MVRGCRRNLNLVVARHMLVPKSLHSSLVPMVPLSPARPIPYGMNSPAMVPDGHFFDRGSIANSSGDHMSLSSRHSNMSVQSYHSMFETPRFKSSLPNYYRASHIHAQAAHPGQHPPVANDGQLAFLTGPVVAQMAGSPLISPHSGAAHSSTGGLSAGSHSPTPARRTLSQSQAMSAGVASHSGRPPMRHVSASENFPGDVLTKPKLLGVEDARMPMGNEAEQAQHLHHYTSVPDLAPHHPHGRLKPRQRYGTSTGVPPRMMDATSAFNGMKPGGSDSLPLHLSRPNTSAAAAASSHLVRQLHEPTTQITVTRESTIETSSSDSAMSAVVTAAPPVIRQSTSRQASAPSTTSVSGTSTTLPPIKPLRPMSLASALPTVELLQSSNGGRNTTPMKPEIIISGSNVGQREITPMKLRAPAEVRSKLCVR